MTQSTSLAELPGSKKGMSARGQTLVEAIENHLTRERVSFHTPGHKGRLSLADEKPLFRQDLTELPGLGELSEGSQVLGQLQKRIARAFNAAESFISVNGASAALMAAILACAGRGQKVLLPVNVHRSAISALIISGQDFSFYEPDWMESWQSWGGSSAESIAHALKSDPAAFSCVVVCSPNYAGVISDLKEIADLCRQNSVVLIVDEAHGAHLSALDNSAALNCGADLVVHSLHKTLGAPTQTGLLHRGKNCAISAGLLKSSLNCLQSSSPSYLFLLGVERAIIDMENGRTIKRALALRAALTQFVEKNDSFELMQNSAQDQTTVDPLHILLKHKTISAQRIYDYLASEGIFAECVLGRSVLFLLGTGSIQDDIEVLIESLAKMETRIDILAPEEPQTDHGANQFSSTSSDFHGEPKQLMNPRQAYFAESEIVNVTDAVGRISSDWHAPCPPGCCVLLPGREITAEAIQYISTEQNIRVVKSRLEGDSDGSNTTSR